MATQIHPTLRSRAVPLSDLTPAERNPRRGDLASLRESLREHGQYQPIVARKETGEIIAGNHRYLAAQAEGWEKIAVVYVDVDDETARRIGLVDNKTSDSAWYDDPLLIEILDELAESPAGLTGTGFDEGDLENLRKQHEAEPPPSFVIDLPDETETFAHTCPRCGFEYDG